MTTPHMTEMVKRRATIFGQGIERNPMFMGFQSVLRPTRAYSEILVALHPTLGYDMAPASHAKSHVHGMRLGRRGGYDERAD
jgi:hypothetical protein